ncbi:HAMP domain-containing protein [Streptomyces beijiangensis]|uniref:histidine kinase n=2 Tax=Streptomyces beijiangensis TaxID=163361 RepID=A0A939JGB6_9ACTN|nr:HAMP domain-containing protein [Streptomyces beijiangensis]
MANSTAEAKSSEGAQSSPSADGPSFAKGGPEVGAYVVQQLNVQRDDQLHLLLVESAIALAVMVALSLLLGWLVAGRVLAPLQSMASTARRISADHLHRRLAVPGPGDELTDLSDTFDDMLARLEIAFEAQRQFVANASHELRTPLTLQQTLVDVALADPGATADTLRAACLRVRAAGQEQERLIDALLTLARSQRGLQEREYVDLAVVAGSLLPESAHRIEADLAPAGLLGDPQLVERLAGNLIDNAVRHNVVVGGGWISVRTGLRAGCPTLRVANSGPAIPPDRIDALFQPFTRHGDQRTRRRDGHGLGLSIVAAIAVAHGGSVQAQPGDGGGLCVEVTFPPDKVSGPGGGDRTQRPLPGGPG